MVGKKKMEININQFDSEKLNSYISIFDNVFPTNVLDTFIKVCETQKEWQDATIVNKKYPDSVVNKKTRNTKVWQLNNIFAESKTEMHWSNLFIKIFNDYTKKYQQRLNVEPFPCKVNTVQALKYEPGGFFQLHSDHGFKTPRTLSFIYFVNDSYEGGSLIFATPNRDKDLEIDKKKNRLIVWPSNFLYPHTVKPVEKGIRYTVVAWAL